ncbi:MAG: ATP-binding protein [Pseudomonadota bacterium]
MTFTPASASARLGPRLSAAIERVMNRAVEERAVVPLAITAMLLVGAGDYATGDETTFTLLYLFPLAFGTWLRGRRFGFFLAAAATCGATLTGFVSAHGPIRTAPLIWNQFASLSIMLLVVWVLTVLRAYVERERSSRELAVEQLRHAERLNIIGKLAAGVAHELGTPLNVISGSAEMLQTGEVNRANIAKYSSAILDQTRKMTIIIRHLLDFGRRGGSSRVSVDLNDVVTHAVELLLPMAKRRSCQLLVEPFERAVPVIVNPAELEQVFSNLLMNALQAMSAGGSARIRVTVETRETAGSAFRPFACVVVQDDGQGIDERDLPHVFDPFFTTKGVGEGTGLGLSVSYGIIQDHAGSIEVSSVKGNGARFAVLLPLASSRNRAERRANRELEENPQTRPGLF